MVLASSALGCAPSGDDPNSRLTVYEPPSGEYRLRYLEPPWELVDAEGTDVFLRISSNSMIFGGFDGGPGKYELHASVVTGTIDSSIAAEMRAAVARGETIMGAPRDIEDGGVVVGRELFSAGMVDIFYLNHRYVFFALSGGRVLRLAFDATPSLDTPEVDAMIAAVEVLGAP